MIERSAIMKKNINTKLVQGCRGCDPHTGAISFPIYQSATFRHPSLNQTTGYDYSRLQNPTREELENTLALLENGKYGFAFSSGMAAVSAILKLFSPNDHIIVSDDLYGGTYRLFEEIYRKYGIDFTFIDTSSIKNIEESIKYNTAAIFVETPSNPMMKVTDLIAVSKLSKSKGILTIVDNTFLTPYYQRPLEFGIDIVLHSGTKYLGGHNDTLAGFIVVSDQELSEKLRLIQKSEGAVLAPFDSWLIQRGIKTLGVRLERQQYNAHKVAQWLKTHKKVEKVFYAGLPESPGYEVLTRQASGFGAMVSFHLKEAGFIESILERVKVFIFAESLGGVESLITYPIAQTHSAIPVEIREGLGVNDKLLRLSVGIEDINDLINDLEQAMR